jgi:hypothetical protein
MINWPRKTVKAMKYAGPSHQSCVPKTKEIAVISNVGPK